MLNKIELKILTFLVFFQFREERSGSIRSRGGHAIKCVSFMQRKCNRYEMTQVFFAP